MTKAHHSLLIAALMLAAAAGAMIVRPTERLADLDPLVSLESMIPRQFGDWREDPQRYVQVVNPQTQAVLDRVYTQVLSRVYVDGSGNYMMLSLAYGSDQRRSLQAHKPEVCYPAQGFVVHQNEAGSLRTDFGEIPVRRLVTTLGARHEALTYWFTVGDKAVQGAMQKRFVDLRYGLTGRIPDGMIFRVSSIDPDPARAHRLQAGFVNRLLESVPPAERKRLSGLGDP